MLSRRASSEFPNDNPELHDGLVWACPAPLGRALPTLRLRAPEGALPRVLEPAWVVRAEAEVRGVGEAGAGREVELAAEGEAGAGREVEAEAEAEAEGGSAAEAAAESELEAGAELEAAASPEPFGVFVATLARVVLARGATRAAAALTALCEHGRLAAGALDDAALRGLVARRLVVPSGTHATPEFVATLDAWRGVLNGTATDLSACGSTTLDSWAAELVAATLNVPSSAVNEVRRDLRRAGVAAFGLLAVAS